MKQSPFLSPSEFFRALVKALILVVLINIGLLALNVNPIRTLVTLNTWDIVGRGRQRLAYPSDFANGQLPLEALLATHAISAGTKPDDEFRVILLGESGIAGWGVPDHETLAAQLTERKIMVDGKQVAAYNLAYPQPGAARDLLILDAALDYEPDLIIWFMTPAALDDNPDVVGANRVFYNLNRERLERLAALYPALLGEWLDIRAPSLLDEPEPLQPYIAIQDQDLIPVWLNSQLYPFTTPDLSLTDRRIGLEEVPDEAKFTDESPGFEVMPNQTWNLLDIGCLRSQIRGAELLIVNEPMLVGTQGASDLNYNTNYERALYDRYREVLSTYTTEQGIWYADLWNIIPPERFTDTPLHMDAEGYAILSAALEDVLTGDKQGSTC